jgi:predicted dinucleotide-binding enzyme
LKAGINININTDRRSTMSYVIVGFGKIGQALAHAFARKNIDMTVASRRPPEALAPQARAIGPRVVAKSLRDALEADTVILAVPFGEHREVAKALPNHLPAATLATDPIVEGGHRVVFLSSDDEDAIGPLANLAKQLGFAPVKQGSTNASF